MNVATLIKASQPIMSQYISFFDNQYDAAFAIGREGEIDRMKRSYDSFDAVYNRLIGAAMLIENARAAEGEEGHGLIVTMLDIFYGMD